MNTETRTYRLVYLLGTVYLLGELSQRFMFVPRAIRWHLSDLGIVGTLGSFLAVYGRVTSRVVNLNHERRTIVRASWLAWLAATVHEVYYGPMMSGVGIDPVDVACYAVALMSILIANRADSRQVGG